jgi:hypothetical protein
VAIYDRRHPEFAFLLVTNACPPWRVALGNAIVCEAPLRPPSRHSSLVTGHSLALPDAGIDDPILEIRGVRIILDSDLARIYGVSTKAFNQAVKRNLARFPRDFIFRLSKVEAEALQISRSQTVTLKRGQRLGETARPD